MNASNATMIYGTVLDEEANSRAMAEGCAKVLPRVADIIAELLAS